MFCHLFILSCFIKYQSFNVYPILSEMKQMSMNDLPELLLNIPIHIADIHLIAE